jgi:hypothetical protein
VTTIASERLPGHGLDAHMSNRTWVCFTCRKSMRRAASYGPEREPAAVVRCSDCGEPCSYLGYKIPVPSRRDRQGWDDLRAQLEHQALSERNEGECRATRAKHAIEREIAELERRPSDPGRDKLIRQLRKGLADI